MKSIDLLSDRVKREFWSKVNKTDTCWEWMRALDKRGYGQIVAKLPEKKQASFRAHRVAWELTNGKIPEGLWVLHKCDNPKCCNPDHLFLGTHQDNMDDAVSKQRMAHGENHGLKRHPERIARGEKSGARLHPETVQRGMDCGASKLTDDQVREIRASYVPRKTTGYLADKFGVHGETIRRVVARKIWKHVI